MDWEAQDEGVIAKILAADGTKDIPVGTVVAVVVEDAEHVRAPGLLLHLNAIKSIPCLPLTCRRCCKRLPVAVRWKGSHCVKAVAMESCFPLALSRSNPVLLQ